MNFPHLGVLRILKSGTIGIRMQNDTNGSLQARREPLRSTYSLRVMTVDVCEDYEMTGERSESLTRRDPRKTEIRMQNVLYPDFRKIHSRSETGWCRYPKYTQHDGERGL